MCQQHLQSLTFHSDKDELGSQAVDRLGQESLNAPPLWTFLWALPNTYSPGNK